MSERQYQVPGISCEHCVRAITNELSEIDGVEVVSVSIPDKLVTIQQDAAVADEAVIAGISEAGFDETIVVA